MSGELIPYQQGPMTEIIEAAGMVSTYNRKDPFQALALFKAVQGTDFGLDDMVGEVIEVEHLVAHKAPMVDRETGEISETTRLVLVGPDGTRYGTRSETVRHDVERACIIFGVNFPLKPPMRFKVVQVKSRDGVRKYLQLIPEIILDATANG